MVINVDDDADDDDDVDDDGDDDDDEEDDERKMMLLMLRRRKMMIMRRRRMLRRNTGPKTEKHTSCEPAQSKCMSAFHNSHFIRKCLEKMPTPRVSTLIKHRPLLLTQEPLSVDTLCGEKAFSRVWGFE